MSYYAMSLYKLQRSDVRTRVVVRVVFYINRQGITPEDTLRLSKPTDGT